MGPKPGHHLTVRMQVNDPQDRSRPTVPCQLFPNAAIPPPPAFCMLRKATNHRAPPSLPRKGTWPVSASRDRRQTPRYTNDRFNNQTTSKATVGSLRGPSPAIFQRLHTQTGHENQAPKGGSLYLYKPHSPSSPGIILRDVRGPSYSAGHYSSGCERLPFHASPA